MHARFLEPKIWIQRTKVYAFVPRFLRFSPDAGRLSGDVTGLCGGGPLYWTKRACGFCSLPSPDTVTLSGDTVTLSGDLTGRFGETSFCCGRAQEVSGGERAVA